MSGDRIKTDGFNGGQEWSYSKSRDFQQCPRKFYFKEKVSADDSISVEIPSADAVHVSAIVGIAVHRSIASQIVNWQEGKSTSFRDAQKEAKNWIRGIWAKRDVRVIEARNGAELQSSTDQKLVGAAKNHLRTFFQAVWPRYRNHEYVLHETLRTFDIGGNQVLVKVDLCTRDEDGNLVITDWKTGDSPVLEIDSQQLDVYALWGIDQLESDIDNIRVRLVHTRTGEFSTTIPDSNQLEKTREKITAECREWANTDDPEDYLPNPDQKKCQSCRFLQVCNAGQEVIE